MRKKVTLNKFTRQFYITKERIKRKSQQQKLNYSNEY